MEYLQTLLDSSSMPVLTAFILGLLTAVSPCPLATNIAAIGYLSKDVTDRRRIFANGLLYTLGRILSYTVLGIVLIAIIREGSSMFGIQKTIASAGEVFVGPLLIVIGLFMLWGDKLNLRQFGFSGNAEKLAERGGWGAFVCLGLLSCQRCFLFRYAHTDVGNSFCRISSSGCFCGCYSPSCTSVCVVARFQCKSDRKYLR